MCFQVANLALYAIALVVFGVSKADTKENTESQVCVFIDPLWIYIRQS